MAFEHHGLWQAIATLRDFDPMSGTVSESGHTFGIKYLCLVADLGATPVGTCTHADAVGFPGDSLETVDRYADDLKGTNAAGDAQRNAVVWDGASKGVVFSLFMERAGAKIDTVMDINPAKQWRYLAATGLRVQSPDAVLSNLVPGTPSFVMSGNSLPEIRTVTGSRSNYQLVDQREP